jgi:DNA-binding CsgD family transcriptional regulator
MVKDSYRNGRIPGRRGYGIDDAELARLFDSGLVIRGIAERMGISQWTVLAHLKKLGLRRTQRHPISKPDAFAIVACEACYWGGFLAADGFVLSGRNGIGVELAAKDASQLECLCHFVGRDAQLRKLIRQKNGKSFPYVQVYLRSSQLMRDAERNFNIVPRKSLVLEPPDLPMGMRRHFIRGYFDGDGSVGWHKRGKTIRFNIVSGSKRILEWVRDTICAYLGRQATVRRRKSKTYALDFYGDAAINIFEWMYMDGGDALCLERKHDRFLECGSRLAEKRAARANRRQAISDEMVGLYAQGLSYSEIAARLGVTKEKVSYHLGKTDIPKRSRRTDSKAGRELRVRDQAMLAAHLAGERADDIATRFGMAKSSFWVAIRRAKGDMDGR